MQIKNNKIKNFNRPFFIAEIGINHNGDLKIAKKLIDHAKIIGADAVKFQSFRKQNMQLEKSYKNQKADFKFNKHTKSLEDIIDKITLSENDQKKLSQYCKKKKDNFFFNTIRLKICRFFE